MEAATAAPTIATIMKTKNEEDDAEKEFVLLDGEQNVSLESVDEKK